MRAHTCKRPGLSSGETTLSPRHCSLSLLPLPARVSLLSLGSLLTPLHNAEAPQDHPFYYLNLFVELVPFSTCRRPDYPQHRAHSLSCRGVQVCRHEGPAPKTSFSLSQRAVWPQDKKATAANPKLSRTSLGTSVWSITAPPTPHLTKSLCLWAMGQALRPSGSLSPPPRRCSDWDPRVPASAGSQQAGWCSCHFFKAELAFQHRSQVCC